MAIPQHTIDQILDRTDIVDLIGQRVKLKKTGRTYSGCCPFHQEKTPSFHVYRDKQYYHCFGCQANGNAIRFLMDIDSRNFVDVMKELSSQTGIELPQQQEQKKPSYQRNVAAKPQTPKPNTANSNTANSNTLPPNASLPDNTPAATVDFGDDPFEHYQDQAHDFQLDHADYYDSFAQVALENNALNNNNEGDFYTLLEAVAQFYQAQLPHSQTAQQYFKQRGLSAESIEFWRLGYAPNDWQHLEKAFPQDIEGLKSLGLIRSHDHGRDYDLLRDRVIFPIRDSRGRIVGFGGRALNDEIKPKYINSPDSEVFHKNQLLYGLYEGRKQKAARWLLVEGYMDVIALQQYGIAGAVATLGTASNADHIQTIFKQDHNLTIAFDGDAAGQKAARRTLEIALPQLVDGRQLQFFVLPAQHDPDSLIRKEGVEGFQRLWQQAPLLSEFIFSLLSQQYDINSPEGKSQVMAELQALIELLPKHGSYRYLLRQYFREKLGGNKKWQAQPKSDAALSFDIHTKIEDLATAILILHPYLYRHFEILRAYITSDTLLAQLLAVIDVVADHLPEDPELACYYILGAASPYQAQLVDIMQRSNMTALLQSPESIDKLALDYSRALQEKYIRLKLKKPSSLLESRNLRQQLNEISKQIGLKLLHLDP
ncbi:DNA primase [Acinetobacter larvae]|uniref:DNA primase n=1 Tax=Acinetobacter larvae TaxID=1789224 RepID=A0A1B2LY22_9GAMM|nr:CHC2 zinc finger domain-containing protein [Acinetobacter larvae]AOA57779.1 DNA primase [Acinetobacter larvae]